MKTRCKKHPDCVGRALTDSTGTRISDPAAFFKKAKEVCELFAGHRLDPASTSTLRECDRLMRTMEMSYLREDDRTIEPLPPGPEGGATLKRFGLCGDHARQVGRGYVVASHFLAMYPDCAVPPADVVLSVATAPASVTKMAGVGRKLRARRRAREKTRATSPREGAVV